MLLLFLRLIARCCLLLFLGSGRGGGGAGCHLLGNLAVLFLLLSGGGDAGGSLRGLRGFFDELRSLRGCLGGGLGPLPHDARCFPAFHERRVLGLLLVRAMGSEPRPLNAILLLEEELSRLLLPVLVLQLFDLA